MRKRGVALAGAIGLAGVAASGFPNRVGVTQSQASLSLPGDLILPTAQTQADRAHEFAVASDRLWAELLAIEDLYAFLWERPLDLVIEEPEELLVWKTDLTAGWRATLTAALLPGTDGHTVVYLRERYQQDESCPFGRIPATTVASALAAPITWFRFRRATK